MKVINAGHGLRPRQGPPRFALIGAAGYVAPRHMKAIQEVGGELVAICDPHDSVGIVDCYFQRAVYFRELQSLGMYLDALRDDGTPVDFISICSPNYLHGQHILSAMSHDAHVICEKPLVIDPSNLGVLHAAEREYNRRIYTILQLRLHENALRLRRKLVEFGDMDTVHDVSVRYVTPRGSWYRSSWKGDPSKSGGILMNIGIHLFDLLVWLFDGPVGEIDVEASREDVHIGSARLARARVDWLLSTNPHFLEAGQTVCRRLEINGVQIDLSTGFENLHTASYRYILDGDGFGLDEVAPALETVKRIRDSSK